MIRFMFRALKRTLNNFFLSHSVQAVKSLPSNGEVCLLDIGAAGEVEPRWRPFIQFLNYVGVEPDERSRSTLKNNKNEFKSYHVLPYALTAKKQTLNFNLCRKPEVSSLYEPNIEFLSRFLDVERFDIREKMSIDCVSLDSVYVPDVDFLKIDIQGAEDDVLKGASSCLSSALGLELEVEFIELYKDQPLFGDVCKTLSQHDFEFIDFIHLVRWERDAHAGYGQCVHGDALFLRSPESMILRSFDAKKWSAYFTILIIYRRFDLIETALKQLPAGLLSEFKSFGIIFHKAKDRDMKVRKIHTQFSRLLRLLGDTYRSHLIQ
jgi:FkbM family methyltransferase